MAMVPTAAMAGGAAGASGGTGFGSSFLTGAGAGLASGLTGGAFGSKGSGLGSQYRHARRHYKKMQRINRENIGPNTIARVEALKAAGLHPLAALGMSTQPSPTFPSVSPGQSSTGSWVGEGIRAGLAHSAAKEARGHAQTMQGLQLEEQKLRNEWVQEQIAASKQARATQAANAIQDVTSVSGQGPHQIDTIKARPTEVTTKKSGSIVPGGFKLQAKPGRSVTQSTEDQYGDMVSWVYGLGRLIEDVYYSMQQSDFNRASRAYHGKWKREAYTRPETRFGFDPYSP